MQPKIYLAEIVPILYERCVITTIILIKSDILKCFESISSKRHGFDNGTVYFGYMILQF